VRLRDGALVRCGEILSNAQTQANNHTIVLFQLTKSVTTRHWNEYANKVEAMDGICKMYELHLKKLNPNVKVTPRLAVRARRAR
jgi:hypothetical protein